MRLRPVTDPEVLRQLESNNSSSSDNINLRPVTDEQLLSELNEKKPESEQESLLSSILKSPFRIGMDVGKAGLSELRKVPEYYRKAKTEITGLPTTIMKHPRHAALQGLAGSQEMINNIAQLPLNLAQYGSERLHLLPKSVPEAISRVTPQNTSETINELFGEPKYPGEELLRGTVRNLPGIGATAKAAQILKPISKKSIVKDIWKQHDTLENKAVEGFNKVSKEVNKRKVSEVPISDTVDMNAIRDFFPNTKQSEELLDKASAGNYDALRKIQTDLYTRGKKNIGSIFETDRIRGEEMLDRRDSINQAISDHLNNTGNTDLANILNQSRNDYRTLQQIYYNPNISSSISNLVNKDIRKVPKNLTSVLKEESIPMKQLREFHPGLESKLGKYGLQKSISSNLIKYGLPAGLAYEFMKGYTKEK